MRIGTILHRHETLLFQKKAKQATQRDLRYQSIMRNLVRRYVTLEQRKAEREGITEDDVNEIKQDISAFRCEIIEILKNSGMNTSTASGFGTGENLKRIEIHTSYESLSLYFLFKSCIILGIFSF